MKLPVHCHQCTDSIDDPMEFEKHIQFVHVTESPVYIIECALGHTEFLLLRHFPHEVLFEIGAQEIEDGYFRETVSSFTSSLERFYEFFIRLTCDVEKIEMKEFEDTWKKVSFSSERQFGAYVFHYLSHFGRAPSPQSNKWKELRNKVIHKGYIPSREEAVSYGEIVLNEIVPVLLELREMQVNQLRAYCAKYHADNYASVASVNPGVSTWQSDLPFTLNWSRLNTENANKPIKLEERLARRPKCYSVINN